MGLKLNAANGGGSVELDVPSTVNSDLALTVPATAGEIIVADTTGDAAFSRTGSGGSSGSAQLAGYQQGTWTPEVQGLTTAGSYTYGTRVGLWTRIGNLVYIQATLKDITTVSSGSGVMACAGFPYDPDPNNASTGAARFDQVDFPADTVYVTASASINPRCSFQCMRDDASDSSISLSVSTFDSNTADVYFTMTYMTDDTSWTPNAGAAVS